MSVEEKINELWNRVQSNEESLNEKKQILNECDELIMSSEIESNNFLLNKLKLIMHKAGKPTDLAALTTEFENIAKLDPTNVDVWICLAETLLHDGKADEAVVPLDFAKTLNPKAEIYILLSLCMRRKKEKDIKQSLEYANEAVKLDMKNGKAWGNLGIAYLSGSGLPNIKKALKAFKLAIANGESKNADTLMNTGTVCELLLDFMSAMKYYEEAMAVTQGWAAATQSLQRLQDRITRACTRASVIEKMRPKLKSKLISRIKDKDEYVIVEIPSDKQDPSHIVLCFDKESNVVSFGVTQTMRAYLIPEKTVLKVPNPVFGQLSMNEKNIKYAPIEGPNAVKIINGATPANVPPVQISSSIA
ncbi:tetratricopeptide repeat protein 5-like [Histomonas meleagridis]|uniref:tetratricopeptide repeat protein 5-like n=1 Tax=Histomonas meleagridis TaxID=135588 RepID=UPI00355A18DA|nr:tetratricopeptide repeat protein 5-like [Histomonas meleagridis]KAH0805375.1 tetratricopeptide repeat protein 5-like [Histomonas meleagridis]